MSPDARLRASVVGGSGYVGGELLRLLMMHPKVDVHQTTSSRLAGKFVHGTHPNLRGLTQLRFARREQLEPVDVLFLALPHGEAARSIGDFAAVADRIIDCSADFRLHDPDTYADWYDQPHPAPVWMSRFVYGLPERFREPLRSAHHASGVGCNAVVTTLAIAPLADHGLLQRVVADVKVGSSEAGAIPNATSHHPERSGTVRTFMPAGHRHQAEIVEALGDRFCLDFTVTSVELVRGALVTCHCYLNEAMSDKDLWRLYREQYREEPFVRLVAAKTGIHRYPEPKLLAGTNYCDIGFAVDPTSGRIVVIAAIDNLMKGAAGTAVQAMNVMCGFDESSGLSFPGLHPS